MAPWDLCSFFAQILTQWRLKYSASVIRGFGFYWPDMGQLKIAPNKSRVCNSVALKGSAHSQESPMLWSCHHAFPARVDWISNQTVSLTKPALSSKCFIRYFVTAMNIVNAK